MKIEKFKEMIEEISRERGISREALLEAIRVSLLSAAKKKLKQEENLEVKISEEGEAKIILKEGEKEKDVTPEDFGRLAAQTAKQVIIQRLRDAEKEEAYTEFTHRQGELITGIVQCREPGGYLVNLGKIETILTLPESIPGEIFQPRERVKLYLLETRKTPKGPLVIVSRAHPHLVKKLFEAEIPEIKEGIVEIKAIAREPGKRTKIAVYSHEKNIGAVGTCIGHLGVRIQNITKELKNERIDVIEWSEDHSGFIVNALSPAKISKVELNPQDLSAKVVVPEKELPLAIGKEGQNVRLAVKLTGWKIDILSEKEAESHESSKEKEGNPEKNKSQSVS